jgi:hypothetical protein
MESFTIYLLKSVLWLSGFALVYLLFLRNERFFTLKRIYLVSGILISIFFPLISVHYQVALSAPEGNPVGITSAGSSFISPQMVSNEKPFNYRSILLFLYFAGILFFSFRIILHISSLYKTIKKANINRLGPAKLIRASEFSSPFSFFNYVFVNPSVNEIEMEQIMNHEIVHVNQKHWFDLLFIELLCLVQWANPFVWIYTGFIRLNHEYLADEVALQRTADPSIYKAALLNQMFSSPVISLSNSFNYSLNKNRFDMMKKIIASPYRKLKVLFVLPVFAIIFYAFAEPEYHYLQTKGNKVTILKIPGIIVKEVKGFVVNKFGKHLEGVIIKVTGTSRGVSTDDMGRFTIGSLSEGDSLVFSYEGYETMNLKPDFTSDMIVKLLKDPDFKGEMKSGIDTSQTPKNKPLVVIDGVVEEKIFMTEIDPHKVISMNVLRDKDATKKYGAEGKNGVIELSSSRGITNPNAQQIRIRSTIPSSGELMSDPLIVIDGTISPDGLNGINPSDIESIAVHKDKRATEKYGEKGKDGVIEIKTKKGSSLSRVKNPDESGPLLLKASETEILKFLAMNTAYPQEARNASDTGRIFVVVKLEKGGIIKECKAFSDKNGISVPVLDEVVIVGYRVTSEQSTINTIKEASTGHLSLRTECLRVANKLSINEIPDWKDKDLEFALAFNFILKEKKN